MFQFYVLVLRIAGACRFSASTVQAVQRRCDACEEASSAEVGAARQGVESEGPSRGQAHLCV